MTPDPEKTPMHRRRALFALALLGACADDPTYVQPGVSVEVTGMEDPEVPPAPVQVTLPIRLEEADERAERDERAAELGVIYPYVTVEDLDLEIEWTLKNLSDQPATARIQINGASELFAYDPTLFVIDPEEDESPPPLMGDVPYDLEPFATLGGVFREEDLAEAALDLELMGRGGISPFTALLEDDGKKAAFNAAEGPNVPKEAWASLIRFDVIVVADQHVVFEFAIRARDHRSPELLHPLLMDAPGGELTGFAPVTVAPPAEAAE
jgi:hypothetical protein